MSTTIGDNWIAGEECRVCGQTGKCLRRRDGYWACARREGALCDSKGEPLQIGDLYLHSIKLHDRTPIDMKELHRIFTAAMDDEHREKIAGRFSVCPKAIEDFEVGYDAKETSYTIPLRDSRFDICAFSLIRLAHGTVSETGGFMNGFAYQQAFFCANNVEGRIESAANLDQSSPVTILIPRGVTNVMAAHSAGYIAIGRASLDGGAIEIVKMLRKYPLEIVIVPDRSQTPDGKYPGLVGAWHVADDLLKNWPTHWGNLPPDMARPRLRMLKLPGKITSLAAALDEGIDIKQAIIDAVDVTGPFLNELKARLAK